MSDASGEPGRSSFVRYWAAATISAVGTAVTTVAMPVLVVQTLHAAPFELGVIRAAQFVPYAVLGLIAGVVVDRHRRRPILVWASVGRALSLGVVPVLWMLGTLQIWMRRLRRRGARRAAVAVASAAVGSPRGSVASHEADRWSRD